MAIKIETADEKNWDALPRADCQHLDAVANRIAKARKVVVVTGAGISCNAGIPDFRSKDGLYNMVKQQHPNTVVKGKDLFDTVLFSDATTMAVFFTFMAQLRKYTLQARPTATHKFIQTLRDKKKLLRCYTQNIDGLEGKIGLTTGCSKPLALQPTPASPPRKGASSTPEKKPTRATLLNQIEVVQLHGDIHTLKCGVCSSVVEWTADYEQQCYRGESPACPSCEEKSQLRLARGMRNSSVGDLRPNIVLYGEEHPHGDLIGSCVSKDSRSKPDVMLIIGTSMKVVGLKKLIRDVGKVVKENRAKGKDKQGLVVLINKTDIGLSGFEDVIDYHIKSDCDDWVLDLKKRIPHLFSVQTTLDKFTTTVKDESTETIEVQSEVVKDLPATPRKQGPTAEEEDVVLLPMTPPRSQKRSPVPDTPVTISSGRRTRSQLRHQVYLPTPDSTSVGIEAYGLLSPPATPIRSPTVEASAESFSYAGNSSSASRRSQSKNAALLNQWSGKGTTRRGSKAKKSARDEPSDKAAPKRKRNNLEQDFAPITRASPKKRRMAA